MATSGGSSGNHRINLPSTLPPGPDDQRADRYAQLVRELGHHKASLRLLGELMGCDESDAH